MPIYEFECPIHGKFEQIWSLSAFEEIKDGVMCGRLLEIDKDGEQLYCGEVAEKIWSVAVTRFEAPPTIVFKNPRTGEFEIATHATQSAPAGYIREELHGPIERSRFEKYASERRYVEDELTTEKLKQGREQTTKNLHEDIKARMNATTNKVFNPETKQEENIVWDEQTKALMKKSMEHTRKRHERIKPKRRNVRLDVNHLDNSNLVVE